MMMANGEIAEAARPPELERAEAAPALAEIPSIEEQLAPLRGQRVAVAMSGVAALLLPGGSTAHSRFRLPVPLPILHIRPMGP